ncbi:zinc finger, CCHC-type containing protein [Tanacetum coccineum]
MILGRTSSVCVLIRDASLFRAVDQWTKLYMGATLQLLDIRVKEMYFEDDNRERAQLTNVLEFRDSQELDMWGEAILMATYLLNKIPRKDKEETPYELWMGRKPSYQYLRVWGCLAKVAVPAPKAQKIGPKSVDCIFIGYAKNSSAYRFIVHESKNPDIQKNTVMESRNASFFEHIFPCLLKETGSSSSLDDKVVQDKRQRDDNDLQDERQDQTEEEVEPRRSKRARNEKSFRPNFVSLWVENEPTSYREAVRLSSPAVQQLWTLFTKDMLKSKFDMKDMGLADVILGIKIIRTQNGLVLSQAHYVDKILNTQNAGDSGQARTPIDTSTRPDLAYAVSRLSRHPVVIEGYNDANWISDVKDSRSTSGYVFTLGGAAISWKSSKQTVIAKSTMESEFIALDKCGEEAEWLRQFVEDIPRWPKPVTAIRVISIDYVTSKDNIADPFTKGSSRELVNEYHLCEREVGVASEGIVGTHFLRALAEPG